MKRDLEVLIFSGLGLALVIFLFSFSFTGKVVVNCVDSDYNANYPEGADPFIIGTTTGGDAKGGTMSRTDYCETKVMGRIGQLRDFICDVNGNVKQYYINCSKNDWGICSKGICTEPNKPQIQPPQQATCIDSDANEPENGIFTRGTVTLQNNPKPQEDRCNCATTGTTASCPSVMEAKCVGNGVSFEEFPCANGCENGACKKAEINVGNLKVKVFDIRGEKISGSVGVSLSKKGGGLIISQQSNEPIFENIPVGEYLVEVTHPDYWKAVEEISIEAGITKIILLHLEKTEPRTGQPRLIPQANTPYAIFPNHISTIERDENVTFYLFGENFYENMPIYVDGKQINRIAKINVINNKMAEVTFIANNNFYNLFPGTKFIYGHDGFYTKAKGGDDLIKVYNYGEYKGKHIFSVGSSGTKFVKVFSWFFGNNEEDEVEDAGTVLDDGDCDGWIPEIRIPWFIRCEGVNYPYTKFEMGDNIIRFPAVDENGEEIEICKDVGGFIRTMDMACVNYGTDTNGWIPGGWSLTGLSVTKFTEKKNLKWYAWLRILGCAPGAVSPIPGSYVLCDEIISYLMESAGLREWESDEEWSDRYATCGKGNERGFYRSFSNHYAISSEKSYGLNENNEIVEQGRTESDWHNEFNAEYGPYSARVMVSGREQEFWECRQTSGYYSEVDYIPFLRTITHQYSSSNEACDVKCTLGDDCPFIRPIYITGSERESLVEPCDYWGQYYYEGECPNMDISRIGGYGSMGCNGRWAQTGFQKT